MKKHSIIIAVTLLNICLMACNDNTEASKNNVNTLKTGAALAPPDPCEGIDKIDICEKAGGIWNMIIPQGSGNTMLTDFKNIYRKDDAGKIIKAMDTAFWINSCTIFEIEKFLKTEKDLAGKLKYDGIRIYLGCEKTPDTGTFPGEQYPHKTSMFIFPTKERKNPPSGKSEHEDDRIKIPLTGGCTSPYLVDNNIADEKIIAFDEVYRKSKQIASKLKDSLSKAIWIDSCVVFTLAKILRLPNANLDGANVNMAAYNKTISTSPRGKFNDVQSTIIIVPSNWDGTKHANNWFIIDCLLKVNKAKAAGGFNHGSLCPQLCN